MSVEQNQKEYPERVVQIRRCACVVKGGRRFSFTALVVVGDGRGKVGYGYGKGVEVPQAVEKAVKAAGRRMYDVATEGGTVPHAVIGRFGSSSVMLMPANAGTGIIAGAAVRSIAEAAGMKDVLTKCRGSSNPLNVVKAAFDAIRQLRHRADVARLRGGCRTMMIHQLTSGPKARTRKRIGRGIGSGHGKTSGRGHKGAGSRSGHKNRITFEGGQMPLVRRIAKRGFNNHAFATQWEVCDIADLEKAFNAGETVTTAELRSRGVLPRRKSGGNAVKLIGATPLTKALTVCVGGCTVGARKSVELAGGKVVTQGRYE